MRYTTIFFDLDGTLTDPAEGITNSVAYALRKFGIQPPPAADLYPFIGPPLVDSFAKYYDFPCEKGIKAAEIFREYFSTRGILENNVFPGIPELLKTLADRGCCLAVSSSKPLVFVEQILNHFQLRQYFTVVHGGTFDETQCRKTDIIRQARALCPDAQPETAIVVGDHPLDVLGAHDNGLPACAVLYGYGSPAEIAAAHPEKTVATVAELTDFLTV